MLTARHVCPQDRVGPTQSLPQRLRLCASGVVGMRRERSETVRTTGPSNASRRAPASLARSALALIAGSLTSSVAFTIAENEDGAVIKLLNSESKILFYFPHQFAVWKCCPLAARCSNSRSMVHCRR